MPKSPDHQELRPDEVESLSPREQTQYFIGQKLREMFSHNGVNDVLEIRTSNGVIYKTVTNWVEISPFHGENKVVINFENKTAPGEKVRFGTDNLVRATPQNLALSLEGKSRNILRANVRLFSNNDLGDESKTELVNFLKRLAKSSEPLETSD